jgi:hypothetical protein
MTKFITSFVLAASIVAGIGSAQAGSVYGNGLRDAAQAGFITTGGVFDGR